MHLHRGISFNSKLVRLKDEEVAFPQCHIQIRFNSKLVRLKAILRMKSSAFLHSFNSKLVRLKGSGFFSDLLDKLCFNSKLVRLKALQGYQRRIAFRLFQFQTGAIKSRAPAFPETDFISVSIPNWCD